MNAPAGPARVVVRLTPRAGTDRIDGVVDGTLRVRVAAPPADGQANESLLRLLAAALGVARRDVRLVSGATARLKLVAVDGVASEAVRARWPGLEG